MTGNKRGRPKTPSTLKILNGNPGKRKLPENEVKPKSGIPDCPDWLHDYAKEEWALLAPKLLTLGLLTDIDKTALSGYCQTYARWREAEEFISKYNSVYKTPNGFMQQIPQVAIAQKSLGLMTAYLGKFGLSPADRAGLVVDKGKNKEDEFESLLSG